ncbi:MAG: Lrp/AsnC family transcriptional regulator [Candidatus Bathyarchaeota archaeon]|nr:Lrp/AsnC family transcriptional regulator [Candidatus Bathyarchaeota archaeon]
MDKLDYFVLSELLKDAQTPFATIAKKIGVSPKTVISRYDKMKKDGIITRCALSIDPSKLGYQGKAFLMITNSPNQTKAATLSGLKKIINIVVITEIIGAFDILAIAFVTDLNSIMKLVDTVKRIDGVERVEVAFIKETDLPAPQNFNKLYSKQSLTLATT